MLSLARCLVSVALISASVVFAEEAGATAPGSETGSGEGAALLRLAFENRYEVDITARIELRMYDRSGREQKRVLDSASKMIDGRLHSFGRLAWPNHLRGMGILTIEVDRGRHDAFVYMPALGRVRRVSTAQRADSFFGSDVTYEDIERRHAEEFVVGEPAGFVHAGERALEVMATPRTAQSYERLAIVVAESDFAILEVRYYKREAEVPFRVVRASRADMISKSGHTLPTRMSVESIVRGTRTEVLLIDLVIGATIEDNLFTASALETGREVVAEEDLVPE